MPLTEQPLEELDQDEMLQLLGRSDVGRLVVIEGHFPLVFPVNYRMDGDIVVFRSHPGTKLHAANHHNVAFHVDHIDSDSQSGWSILIQGVAEDSTDHRATPNIERARQLDIRPWAHGDKRRLVRIIPIRMTGRRLTANELEWSTDPRGYL
jgi:nitroimidazol reductase NimA-like FMN-containing flavoprotein (pyridoxamine 5'-phosphate oxidase superfamily)